MPDPTSDRRRPISNEEARQALHAANMAIAAAVQLIRAERDALERFFEEKAKMDSVGPILDPTLFNSSERRAVEALLSPTYRAALDLVATYDRQLDAGRDALTKVKRDG